jgi:hypothetical protein
VNHLKIAKETLKAHDWESATRLIENILLMDPDCKDAWYMKALLHIRDETGKSFETKADGNMKNVYGIFSKEDIRKCWGECTLSITFNRFKGYFRSISGNIRALIKIDDFESFDVGSDECVRFGVNCGEHKISVQISHHSMPVSGFAKMSFIASKDHKFEINSKTFSTTKLIIDQLS